MNKHGYVPIKFYLWKSKFKFYIILTCQETLFFWFSFNHSKIQEPFWAHKLYKNSQWVASEQQAIVCKPLDPGHDILAKERHNLMRDYKLTKLIHRQILKTIKMISGINWILESIGSKLFWNTQVCVSQVLTYTHILEPFSQNIGNKNTFSNL